MNFIEELKKIRPSIDFHFDEECYKLYFTDDKLDVDFELDLDFDKKKALEYAKIFLKTKYEFGRYIYRDNYFEILIDVQNIYDIGKYLDFKIIHNKKDTSEFYYEISNVSEIFEVYIRHTMYGDEISIDRFKSIKIYNLNKALHLKLASSEAITQYFYFTNSILFELAFKYNLQLRLINLDNSEEFGVNIEEAVDIDGGNTILERDRYDSDLLKYYNRAILMSDSEFKYLAFFQVLECIFEEVYIYETVKDIQSVIESNWFSPNDFEHLKSVANIAYKRKQDKTDRSKIKLVLEKYFKGDLRDEAYCLANREIIEILKYLEYINKDRDITDIQRIAKIVYDYRCECTHSDRKFQKNEKLHSKPDSLKAHIYLVKKIAEKIILNYRRKW